MQNSSAVRLKFTGDIIDPKAILTFPAEYAGFSCYPENLPNRILDGLPEREMSDFLSFAKNVYVSSGECIYRPGEKINYVYFPMTAVFSQTQILEDGKTCETAMIGKEGFLSFAALGTESAEATAWTEASVPGIAYRIESEAFRSQFNSNVTLQNKIIDYANSYARQLAQKALCANFHTVKERFCSWLLTLQEKTSQRKLFFTQESMARKLGVNRPILTTTALELKDRNVISYSRGRLEIINLEALKTFACACSATTEIL